MEFLRVGILSFVACAGIRAGKQPYATGEATGKVRPGSLDAKP